MIPVGISFTTFRGHQPPRRQLPGPGPETFPPRVRPLHVVLPLSGGGADRPDRRVPAAVQVALREGTEIDVTRALYLIALGLVKKVVIGDFLARSLVDGVFSTPGQYSSLDVVVGIHAYAVQIYCDFSGYTDMAIGIALLLGRHPAR